MPTATITRKPKIKSVTVVQVVRPLTDKQKRYARMADLIERGMQKHPTWGQAHGVDYRIGRVPASAYHAKYQPEQVTRACAIGFAIAGADFGDDPVFNDVQLRQHVIKMNDCDHRSLLNIINVLRAEASTH